jgi:hypothetical protein
LGFSAVISIMTRKQKVARSVVYAILENDQTKIRSLVARFFAAIATFFALYQLPLIKLRNDLFLKLRNKWLVDDEDYKDSFGKKDGLQAKGDMGFSGSVSILVLWSRNVHGRLNPQNNRPFTLLRMEHTL